MTIPQANSMVTAIRRKVRHLTNSPDENTLTNEYIDETLNDIYNTDFPYAIKIDQMRAVYEIYTQPFIDRYPIDINNNQGIRGPAYFDGVQGAFYKDRIQFYNLWPNLPTQLLPAVGNGVDTIFSFQVIGPFLRQEVMIGTIDTAGNPITVKDDGQGNLLFIVPNPQISIPSLNANPALPGMYNQNVGSAGIYNPTIIGTVNYVTGQFNMDFSLVGVIPAPGNLTLRISQYQPGKPYSILFWNNEFIVRPVPNNIHKIEVETYLTPVQFMAQTDIPIIRQWWKYLAYLVSSEIQRERNDFESVAELQEGAKRQEALVLERQGVEEIGQPNFTLFNSTIPNLYLNNFWGIGV